MKIDWSTDDGKAVKCLLVLLLGALFLCFVYIWGKDLAGLADYEGSSKKYLRQNGYSNDVVDTLLNYRPLGSDMVAQLTRVPQVEVRVMLAKNPHLTLAERQELWKDKNKYVRQSLAQNLRLSPEEMATMFYDPPYTIWERLFLSVFPYASSSRNERITVLGGLARNPTVPREMLLQMFEDARKHGYSYSDFDSDFAMNPNCPAEIIDKIKSKELNRIQWTQERKEEYRQLKAQGMPFPSSQYIWKLADVWWRDEDDGKAAE